MDIIIVSSMTLQKALKARRDEDCDGMGGFSSILEDVKVKEVVGH